MGGNILRYGLWLIFLVFAAFGAAAESDLPPVLRSVRAGPVTANFGGTQSGGMPVEFAASRLWFSFDGDNKAYVFRQDRPTEEGDFRHWNFDIFSPEGGHALLLLDHSGPYHIVPAAKLKDYLAGKSGPDFVVEGAGQGEAGGVHSGARWLSPAAFQFVFSCCASEQILEFSLGGGRTQCLKMRDATDAAQGPWRDCAP